MTRVAKVDVVGVGLNATDTTIHISEFPECGSRVEYDSERVTSGGQVASTVLAFQPWGLCTRYMGKLAGSPDYPCWLRRRSSLWAACRDMQGPYRSLLSPGSRRPDSTPARSGPRFLYPAAGRVPSLGPARAGGTVPAGILYRLPQG